MAVFFSIIAALLELAGVGSIGFAWLRSASSGHEIYAASLQTRAGPIRTFDIDLDPSMNPVYFGFSAQVDHFYASRSSMKQEFNYKVSLTLDRKPVLDRRVTFDIDPEKSVDGKKMAPQRWTGAGLDWPDVPVAGRYRFAMTAQSGGDHRAIQDIDVKVRRNVQGVKMKLVWWGVGMIVLGGLIQFLFGAPLPGSRQD